MLKQNLSASRDTKNYCDSDKNHQSGPTPITFTETIVSHQTPVLFSTNRGLFLRRCTSSPNSVCSDSTQTSYELNFCDLERWSTNRANSICFSDTIGVQTKY